MSPLNEALSSNYIDSSKLICTLVDTKAWFHSWIQLFCVANSFRDKLSLISNYFKNYALNKFQQKAVYFLNITTFVFSLNSSTPYQGFGSGLMQTEFVEYWFKHLQILNFAEKRSILFSILETLYYKFIIYN